MTILKLDDIIIKSIIEHEVPIYSPTDMFDEATPEALEPYRYLLEPDSLCPVTGNLIMPVVSYLVITQKQNILIDTCCGCNKTYAEPPGWHQKSNALWLKNLEAAGAPRENIDFVICTHLHSDHCGWNTQLIDGKWVPTFPNAKYIFTGIEYAEMKEEGHQIFIDNIQPVIEANQAILVDLDYALNDQIWLEPAVGHSIGHVAINIKSKNNLAIMCGDLIHSPMQLLEPDWSCNSDYDLSLSTKTRRNFLDKHCDTNNLILTSHFPSPSIGYIISKNNIYDFDYIR